MHKVFVSFHHSDNMADMFKCILLNKRFENLNKFHWNMFKGIIDKQWTLVQVMA